MGPNVTVLGGGIGCGRLAGPLAAQLPPGDLTLVINTADDLWRYGQRICPDIDTNLYTLSGLLDSGRGWGVRGDTFHTMDRLRALGDDPWFNVGDLDLATHLMRTGLLDEGRTLTEATTLLAHRLGIDTRILPMTDSEVSTHLSVGKQTHPFQEWFVKLGAAGPVERVVYEGIEGAEATPEVLGAIADADLVVIGPSNPVASIEPILTLPGVADLLEVRRRSVVAVSPIVTGVAISDSGEAHRAKARCEQMRARGLSHSASAVSEIYARLAATFVLDNADRDEQAGIESSGQQVVLADTIVSDEARGRRLAATILDVGATLT